MEQTLVNQFFPAVKNSFQNHPAKRRKVSDSPVMDEAAAKKQLKDKTVKSTTKPIKAKASRSKSGRSNKAVELTLTKLLQAKPLDLR